MKFFSRAWERLFEDWIRDYQEPLYKHALWMTGSAELAADMVQETYYQAWSGRRGLREKDKAFPWLLAILRRRIHREHRYQYRHRETMTELHRMEAEYENEPGLLLEIYRAMEMLSPNHREIFLLFHLHGFSYEDISTQLEIPVGTVTSRLARARDALKGLLQPAGDDNVISLGHFRADKMQEKSDG